MSAAEKLRMPFPEPVKYALLVIAIVFLLLALGFLAWQVFRCYSQIYTQQDKDENNMQEILSSEQHQEAPSIKVDDISTEVPSLSHFLSQSSLSSSEYSQLHDDIEEDSVKMVGGVLHFSVHYDQLQSRLVVTILQLESLQQHKLSSSFQLFVKLLLMWDSSQGVEVKLCQDQEGQQKPCVLWTVLQEWRSCIVKSISNPAFGDQFSSVLQENISPHHITLRMEVRDFDAFSRNTVLGEVRVPLRELNISNPLELHKELQTPKKDLVGKLLLSLNFLPTSQRLEIGLLKVNVATTNTSSKAALCVRISVKCNQCNQKYQKSSLVAHNFMTVFNEAFLFSMPEAPLVQCKISVSVYEKKIENRKSVKRLIGQVIFGKERTCEDKHWTLMMRSVRQPVALWHGLLI